MRRPASLALALILALQGAAPAQVIQTAVTAQGTGVPAVPAGSLGALSGSPSAGLAAPLDATLSAGLPGLAAAPTAVAASQAAAPSLALPSALPASLPASPQPGASTPAPRSAQPVAQARPAASALPTAAPAPSAAAPVALSPTARPGLRIVASALGQDGRAAAARPGLAHLGSDAAAPRAEDSPDSQRAGAASFFEQKAFLEGSEDFDALDVMAEAARGRGGRRGAGGGDSGDRPKPEPEYPSRKIRFNGQDFPSSAFRPGRPIEPLIVQAIDAAKEEIHIAVYEFKQREVLKALRRARERGVKVHVIVDYETAYPRKRAGSEYVPRRSFELQSLISEGFDVAILDGLWRYGIQHNKFAVFDGRFALFGSYNWSWTSEDHHYENIKFTDDKRHVKAFAEYWAYMRNLGVSFEAARSHRWPTEVPAPPQDASPDVVFNGVKFPTWFFSPNGPGEDWIIKAIEAAKESIDISMFTFRSTRIAEALVAAKRRNRNLKLRVLLDKSQGAQDHMRVYAEFLAFHKIPVRMLAGPNVDGPEWAEKDHNKLMVVDRKLVETGSMNWTKNGARMNFENGHFTNDPVDARAYSEFYDDMWSSRRAERVVPPATAPTLPTDDELVQELLVEPEPAPPPPVWPELPPTRQVRLNGETFPSAAVRPVHGIRDLLIKAIGSSEKTLQLAVYEFNVPELLQALRRAKARGVKVRVVVDFMHAFPRGKNHAGEERERSAEIAALVAEGFDVRVLRGAVAQGSMHNKFAVFDGAMLELGSYNWAVTAEENHFEDIKFTDEKERVSFYQSYWEWMYRAAQPFDSAEEYAWSKNRPGPAPRDEDLALAFNGERFPRQAVSPQGGVEETLIRAIQAAKATLQIAMFSFYSKPIAEALLRAKERGVRVSVIVDAGQAKLMKLDEWFAYYDFDVKVLAGPNDDGNVMFEKLHDKFMLLDGKLLETGSFNYTPNAEQNNFDNASFFDDPLDLAFYSAYFALLYSKGWKPLKPKRPPSDHPEPAEFFSRFAAGEAAGIESLGEF